MLSRTLNYTQAAKTLYISQPILTRHIQEMERELGTALFWRTTHGVALTEAGRILSMQARELINKCDMALNLLHIQNLPVKGSIRIACEVELSYTSYLRTFVGQFMARYPNIDIQLEVETANTPLELARGCDFLFTPCNFPHLPPQISRYLLRSHGTYALLPPGHALMSKSLLALHQLAGETLIVPYADEIFGPYAQNLLLTEKSTQGRLRCLKVPNLSTALFWVAAGRGIAIVPRHVRNMVPPDAFLVGISDRNCRFNEYLYYNEHAENGAAKLFFEEFRSAHFQPVSES